MTDPNTAQYIWDVGLVALAVASTLYAGYTVRAAKDDVKKLRKRLDEYHRSRDALIRADELARFHLTVELDRYKKLYNESKDNKIRKAYKKFVDELNKTPKGG